MRRVRQRLNQLHQAPNVLVLSGAVRSCACGAKIERCQQHLQLRPGTSQAVSVGSHKVSHSLRKRTPHWRTCCVCYSTNEFAAWEARLESTRRGCEAVVNIHVIHGIASSLQLS